MGWFPGAWRVEGLFERKNALRKRRVSQNVVPEALDHGTREAKTIDPSIEPRNNLARDRVDTGEVRALAEIRAATDEIQVRGIIAPTMLPGNHVLDVMPQRGSILARLCRTWSA